MLVATTSDGKFLSLHHHNLEREKLDRLRKENQFFCPACREEVILKLGEKQTWHFAHKRKLKCHDELEGETAYHINGKKLLYDWLVKQHLNVMLEPYLQEIKQRPDLLVTINKKRFAIEYQCSKINPQLFEKRTIIYQKNNFTPIWILGGKQLNQVKSNVFNLNNFHWLFCYNNLDLKVDQPQLLSFCPEINKFIHLENILALSASRSVCTTTFFSPHHFSFSNIFQKNENQRKINTWFYVKMNWRNVYQHMNDAQKFIRDFYVRKGIPSQLFPAEAGVPTSLHYFIETPTYVWQSYIIEMFISNKRIGEKIHINLITRAIKTLIRKGIFKVRKLPLMQTNNVQLELAINYYLQFLCDLNVLLTYNEQVFIKKNEVKVIKTIEEAIIVDKIIENKFKSLLKKDICVNSLKK